MCIAHGAGAENPKAYTLVQGMYRYSTRWKWQLLYRIYWYKFLSYLTLIWKGERAGDKPEIPEFTLSNEKISFKADEKIEKSFACGLPCPDSGLRRLRTPMLSSAVEQVHVYTSTLLATSWANLRLVNIIEIMNYHSGTALMFPCARLAVATR
ncbi:uncharacterized protein H6S33_000192 [Morchella sextelata]|uniref:uncharacterized protein n=1 Tax=Morchella sextelata TaxID=1174677 RepID=UPI001D039068|nr:uncharacterized protein H6S33_000192 [Morchella sextelata]KAH0614556.1 hypothetical protein H6S33_000192 [Morchella sextelata]